MRQSQIDEEMSRQQENLEQERKLQEQRAVVQEKTKLAKIAVVAEADAPPARGESSSKKDRVWHPHTILTVA